MKWEKNWYGTPVKCVFCALTVEPDDGVILNMGDARHFLFHERCLRTLADVATKESTDMQEVNGVWYIPEEKPVSPPMGHMRTRNPRVIYEEAAAPIAQEPLKYRPTIPPRRKPS